MSYQAQSYASQGSGHGTRQDISWTGNNHGGTRETTNLAAEALHSMSNASYTPNSQSTTHLAASYSSRYTGGSSESNQEQAQAAATRDSYNTSQPQSQSVNTNRAQATRKGELATPARSSGYPSQSSYTLYDQQQQRPASAVQRQHNLAPASSARNTAMTSSAILHFNNYSGRQPRGAEASRYAPIPTSSSSYNYSNAQVPPPPIIPSHAIVSDTYNRQSITTVDPMAVYDPWLDYQRKQEVLRGQKVNEDAAHEENKKMAEVSRKAEEERKRQEEEEKQRQSKPETTMHQAQRSSATEAGLAPDPTDEDSEAFESEVKALMARMRELNQKDPTRLARLWGQGRRVKEPNPQSAESKSATQPTIDQPPQTVQASNTQIASSTEQTIPRKPLNASVSKPASPVPVQTVAANARPVPRRPVGGTIWPVATKALLATTAANYLHLYNPNIPSQPTQIRKLLDTNPSYIELCEQLEHMGMKLDRAGFARTLLSAAPDVGSTTNKTAPQPAPVALQRAQVPTLVMKREAMAPVMLSSNHNTGATLPANKGLHPSSSNSATPAGVPILVAETESVNPEPKPTVNKEEAARKRKLSDLVDLTLLSDDDDMEAPPKRVKSDWLHSFESKNAHDQQAVSAREKPTITNFPIANPPNHQSLAQVPSPAPLRRRDYVDQLDRKKALRRNTYNPATIARDVLLACGRHPFERQLNQHLDVLKKTLPQISFDSDLSTIKWDIIDPGNPPPGYFRDGPLTTAEDADNEGDSGKEEGTMRPEGLSHTLGGEGGAQVGRVQALPEAINPFKPKRKGRPPRSSLPNQISPTTPKRPSSPTAMSASAPRATTVGAGVGYQAFRSAAENGSDGQPLPKKRGRPAGWRKAIHGSAAAQARPSGNRFTSTSHHNSPQPSSLRDVKTAEGAPTLINSRSPSLVDRTPQFQAYKCKWHNCKAELHNLETLKKHVFKVHRKQSLPNTLECAWDTCSKELTNQESLANTLVERHTFDLESNWHDHIQRSHFGPLSWEFGDGPASGLSGNEDN